MSTEAPIRCRFGAVEAACRIPPRSLGLPGRRAGSFMGSNASAWPAHADVARDSLWSGRDG